MPVSYGPSDINNPRGTPFGGPVPESYWLTKALIFDFEWVMAEAQNLGYDKKDYEDPTPLTALKDCLRTLRSYEVRLSLTTNRKTDEIMPELHRLNLAEDFDNIRCAEDVRNLKPSPELHQLTMDMLGVKPWRTVAFESRTVGVEAARAAGIFCVGHPPMADHVDMTLDSFTGLPLVRLLDLIDNNKRVKMGLV
jgi:beta-phosphoglucomutase-like phosphatase (HAD superfamily)